jgi:hypothetical protein
VGRLIDALTLRRETGRSDPPCERVLGPQQGLARISEADVKLSRWKRDRAAVPQPFGEGKEAMLVVEFRIEHYREKLGDRLESLTTAGAGT